MKLKKKILSYGVAIAVISLISISFPQKTKAVIPGLEFLDPVTIIVIDAISCDVNFIWGCDSGGNALPAPAPVDNGCAAKTCVGMTCDNSINPNTPGTKTTGVCAVPVAGVPAGTENGQILNDEPTLFCSTGTHSPLSGDGSSAAPWTWTCYGQNGGADVIGSALLNCTPTYKNYSCPKILSNVTCDNSNEGQAIILKTAQCSREFADTCRLNDTPPSKADCVAAGVACEDVTTVCPAPLQISGWREVAP